MAGSSVLLNCLYHAVENFPVFRAPKFEASCKAVLAAVSADPVNEMNTCTGYDTFEWKICDVQGIFNSMLGTDSS